MVEPGYSRGEAGVGRASRGPFPPGAPRGERVGGCGLFLSLHPAALRGIAAELRPFLFRRFLPLSLGLPCGRPGPAPSRPASPSLPCGKGRARLPGATAPAPGRARCGAGRGFAGEDPARLRHQLHCAGSGGAAGGGHRSAATAPPPSSPVPPQKTQPRRRSPSLSALHHVSSSSSRPPRTRRPRGPGRCASCSVGSGPAPARGARGGRGAASLLPRVCGGRAPAPAARWRKGDGEGKLAAEPESPRGWVMRTWCGCRLEREGGETGTHCSSGWLLAGKGACCAGGLRASRPAGRAMPAGKHRIICGVLAKESKRKGWDFPGGFSLPTRAEKQLQTDL